MPEKWTGVLIGKMHNARVSYDDLAAELGLTKGYLSMILNGKRNPPGARKRLEDAVKAVIERRKEEQMKVRLTFLEPVLGTWPSNENIARDFIASKAPDASTIEDEIAALGADAVAEKGKTVFPRTDGQPILYDYQIKGFFKDACGMLARVKSKKSSALKAYKKIIDGLIFVEPRMIPIEVNGEVGECQRPLRAQTAQGERISLANSEEIPAGSTIEFEIVMLDEKAHKEAVLEWLEYGRLRGIGQWRNSGKGRFTYEVLNG